MSEVEGQEVSTDSVAKNNDPTPKWEASARERISASIRKIVKPFEALKARDAVEADTRLLVTDVLCDVLGYDKYEDLTAEYQVKGEFADYGIRVDKQLVAFLEIKRVSQKLNPTHLRQVENYALKNGVQWAILTNAQHWQLYHVQALTGEQSELTLVVDIDLLDAAVKPAERTNRLFLMSREGIQKGRLEAFWKEKFATSPKALKPVLLSDAVVGEIRKELWRKTKQRVDESDLRTALTKLLNESE
jgi:hypothetical protein